jgi:MinD-like ATPase involved in chromosome partitioning or flagellar assembly
MGLLSKLLGTISGNSGMKMSEQLLFDKVIGFRGIVPGVGTSTIVQNVAIALSENTNYSVCVLDTHYLYPSLYPMLLDSADSKRRDYLDFNGDLSDIIVKTAYKNLHLLSMSNRTIVDMLSSRDSELTVDKLISSMKSFFDIVLVDLSYELTNITTHTAIKCNKIINVADQSLKCVYNLRKSINTMSTLAVPLAKANKVVLNKVIADVLTNTRGVISDAGLTVLGEIPFSKDLATAGVSGKRIYAGSTANNDIHAFSAVINTILDDIVQATPLNAKYTDPQAVEESKTKGKDTKVDFEDTSESIGDFVTEAEVVIEQPVVEKPVEKPVPAEPVKSVEPTPVAPVIKPVPVEKTVPVESVKVVEPATVEKPAVAKPTPVELPQAVPPKVAETEPSTSAIVEEDIEEEVIGNDGKNKG